MFDSAQDYPINYQSLGKITSQLQSKWLLFSKAETTDVIKNTVVHLLQNSTIFHGIISRLW